MAELLDELLDRHLPTRIGIRLGGAQSRGVKDHRITWSTAGDTTYEHALQNTYGRHNYLHC